MTVIKLNNDSGKLFGYESEAMNPEPMETVVPQSGFAKLLATGLVGWVLGSLVLLAAGWYWAHSETIAIAAMWAITHWWAAFAFGAVLLLADSLISRLKSATALMAYLLPVALLALVAGICVAIYPDPGFRSDLFGYMALVLVFYVLGFLWMMLGRGSAGNTAFLRLVLPAMVGGLVVLSLVAMPVFTSNYFIYRKAFGLSVSKATVANGAMIADAVLEIHKPGDYTFSAPRFIFGGGIEMTEPEPAMEYGKITWGTAGPPKNGVPGTYPLQIRWGKNIPVSLPAPPTADVEREMISLEIHNGAKQDAEPIFNISAPLPIARR
ncbi:MAG: hypothetical protein ABIT37_10875 [Luteolibacter sp.]